MTEGVTVPHISRKNHSIQSLQLPFGLPDFQTNPLRLKGSFLVLSAYRKNSHEPPEAPSAKNELTYCFIKRKWSGGSTPPLPPLFERREKKERKTYKIDAERRRLKTTGNGKKPLYVGPDKNKTPTTYVVGVLMYGGGAGTNCGIF